MVHQRVRVWVGVSTIVALASLVFVRGASLTTSEFLVAAVLGSLALAWLSTSGSMRDGSMREGFAAASDIFGGAVDDVLLPAFDRLVKAVRPPQEKDIVDDDHARELAMVELSEVEAESDDVRVQYKLISSFLCMLQTADPELAKRLDAHIKMDSPQYDEEGGGTDGDVQADTE